VVTVAPLFLGSGIPVLGTRECGRARSFPRLTAITYHAQGKDMIIQGVPAWDILA
jgi:hypothetical protein